jgi:hypothetical protein
MRHVYSLIAAFCLAGCRTPAPPPPPPSSGVRINVPFVHIDVAKKPQSAVIVDETPPKVKGY